MSERRITDRNAVRIALEIAIDTEEAMIDAYTNQFNRRVSKDEPAVVQSRRHIAAFKRILDRYYGGYRSPKPSGGGRPMSFLLAAAGKRLTPKENP